MLGLIFSLTAMTAQIGTFTFAHQQDPVTDATQAGIVLTSDRDVLMIGCNKTEENRIRITFDPRRSIKVEPLLTQFVTIRFDQGKPELGGWNITREVAFIRDPKRVNGFVRQLVKAEKVVIRVAGADGQYIDGVFQITSAREALAKLSSACAAPELERAISP